MFLLVLLYKGGGWWSKPAIIRRRMVGTKRNIDIGQITAHWAKNNLNIRIKTKLFTAGADAMDYVRLFITVQIWPRNQTEGQHVDQHIFICEQKNKCSHYISYA